MELENKVAIITGSASGIGKATAMLFAKKGAKVVLADFNEAGAIEVKDAINASGGTAEAIKVDVTKDEDNDRMFEFAIEKFGHYNTLIINAGIMDNFDVVHTVPKALHERVMAVNYFGPTYQMGKAVKYFLDNKIKGAIVVTGSQAGVRNACAGVAYTASKHAIHAAALNSAFAYADTGLVRINVVATGAVNTNISGSMNMENLDPIGSVAFNKAGVGVLYPRLGEPEELAQAMAFLASDDASFINGSVLGVDGGWSAY